MSKELIEHFINTKVSASDMVETGIKGVKIFKITQPVQCAPAVYEPSVTAIVSGQKEAIWNGAKYFFDSHKYICCTMSMPIETGTPEASPEQPLVGVYISIDSQLMTELVLEIQSVNNGMRRNKGELHPKGLLTAKWDNDFTEALNRLLLLAGNPADLAILSKSRLRELYYTMLKGEAGFALRRSYGVDNEIARSIEYLSSNLSKAITIDDMADYIGMSRAVLHRKFKQATNLSPIQFVKSMRLNHAAMKISAGINVNIAAMEVGYVSSSQFSREFKRMFGASPKHWMKGNTVG
ncbi:AraC family transcriptional regulator [Rheinheimera sp. UJ63]|uniref:AraC family transcriptional regulator n=1 Tax=Rheinheimera sp. UJ63 TaxID=2910157 RepID=UPI001F2F7E14|nr:AraC family transcriptional regulator [Rheinheimera sp. UJ63]MCF4008838.1 AraC family transcriptional regulator [Rheinheimera sp. UJ63]